MAVKPAPRITARKQPRQARANALIAAVLDAAVQVLENEGAARFTTARVAERAGVSVGSIYQYFPNKASILFRLQAEEWERTTAVLRLILEDASVPPMQRLRDLVHAFIASECEEAQVRTALDDAAPLYRDAPEAGAARAEGTAVLRIFVAEVLPTIARAETDRAADLIERTLAQVGNDFSVIERTPAEVAAQSDAMADMFCAYLERLAVTA